MHKSGHRDDIDGLRALAIVPVVWFHSGLPGIPGGFTGVDTFFVISGYLISAIIHRQVAAGTFTFTRFYERRVRRIAPALLTVLAATLAAGALLLLPEEFVSLGHSAIAAIAMVPNIYFWHVAGYFALGDGITPLLHTWSLGVEEQFYLFFPVGLIIAERLKLVRPLVIAIALVSFALCVVGTSRLPSFAFYLLPTRAWELMLGAMLAVGALRIPDVMRQVTAAVGLALLVAAMLFITEGSSFPGWVAAVPAVGATLIIGSGPSTYVNQAIANRLFKWIGLISYSLYLWHWPVFVFMRHYRAEETLPAEWAVAGILLSFALAAITYYKIEQPPRRTSTPYRRVWVPAAVGAAALAALGFGISAGGGLPGRFDPHVLALAARKHDLAPYAHACINVPLDRIDAACHLGPAGAPRFILWGDSHAAAVSEGVALGLGGPGVLAAMNTCAPALGWTNSDISEREAEKCAEQNEALLRRAVADSDMTTVILAGYWPFHARDGGAAMWAGVEALGRRLQAAGKQVIIVAGTPEPGQNVPWAGAIHARFGRPQLRWQCPAAAVPVPGIPVIDLSAAFCADPHPEQLYTDGNHASRTAGQRVIAPAVAAFVRDRQPL